MNRKTLFSFVMTLTFFFTTNLLWSQSMSVPGNKQGKLFKRIFSYDKSLRDFDEIRIFIVGGDKEEKIVQELVKTFRDIGHFPAVVGNALMGDLPENSVVYLLPGADMDIMKRSCTESGVLSISGLATLAEAGNVSVGLAGDEHNQRIVVNLPRLKSEKHKLSADLLKVARVIR